MAGVTEAFVGLLKAMAEKPKSQYKSKNHQHCHYEDEDLCSFTHITHFFFFFLSFCFWGLLQRFELRNSESDRVCFGFVDFSKDGFDFEFGFFFVFFSWWVRENEGERERERERERAQNSVWLVHWLAGHLLGLVFVILRIGKELTWHVKANYESGRQAKWIIFAKSFSCCFLQLPI